MVLPRPTGGSHARLRANAKWLVGGYPMMGMVKQLRALIAAVDPKALTRDDRLALLDLYEKSSSVDGSAA